MARFEVVKLFRWSFRSSGTWLFVVRREVPDVSKDHISFIFKAKQSKKKAELLDLNMKDLRPFKMSGNTLQRSQRHIQENLNLRLVKCPQGLTPVVPRLCYCPTFWIRLFKKSAEDASIWHVSYHVLHSTRYTFSPRVSNRFKFKFYFFRFFCRFWFAVAYCTQLLSQAMYSLMMATMAETCSC